MTGTLTGVRVVSTAVNIPGPVASAMLRDMGATVVKVEPPAGDPLSAAAPGWYQSLCAGMQVVRLDLKSPEGRSGLDNLLADADLLLTASRPASLERLGLSWPTLLRRYPKLCHVAIVGYERPREEVVGHDLTYQAVAGLIADQMMPRTFIADLAGAQQAVIASLELLLARGRDGTTARAEIALAECARFFAEPLRQALTTPAGALGGAWAVYNIYPTREGWLAIAALEPDVRVALGRELSVDLDDRAALRKVLSERSAADWERWAEERGWPIAALRDPQDG